MLATRDRGASASREDITGVEISGRLAGVPGVTSTRRISHVLRLDPDPAASSRPRFRSSVRRNVRAARASGLSVRRASSEADMTEVFYRLQLMTRRRLGLPAQPRRFFRRFWRDVARARARTPDGRGGRRSAGRRSRVPHLERRDDLQVRRLGSGRLAPAAEQPPLRRGDRRRPAVAGCTTFHFGRTDVDDEGLRRFKLGWGAEETPLRSTWFGDDPPRRERSGPPPLLREARAPLAAVRRADGRDRSLPLRRLGRELGGDRVGGRPARRSAGGGNTGS